jgi:hypothetical protein
MKVEEKIEEWMQTFSPVESMASNPAALAKEMETITSVFTRERADETTVDKVFRHVKMTISSRAWPTPAQVYEALRHILRETGSEVAIGSRGGDRSSLSRDEHLILINQIIPTARRWLREYPSLRHNAIKTLQHWEEPVVDDRGKDWTPKEKAN